jgi:hypothetical protein
MHWIRLAGATVFALSWPVVTLWWQRKEIRDHTKQPPTYEKLRQERDSLLFGYGFLLFWVFFAAQDFDWSVAGKYTGALVAMVVTGVYWAARGYFRWKDRAGG